MLGLNCSVFVAQNVLFFLILGGIGGGLKGRHWHTQQVLSIPWALCDHTQVIWFDSRSFYLLSHLVCLYCLYCGFMCVVCMCGVEHVCVWAPVYVCTGGDVEDVCLLWSMYMHGRTPICMGCVCRHLYECMWRPGLPMSSSFIFYYIYICTYIKLQLIGVWEHMCISILIHISISICI